MATSAPSPGAHCCSASASRSSSFTSRRPTTSCGMPASNSPRRIFWARQDSREERCRGGPEGSGLALAHEFSDYRATCHLLAQLVETLARLELAFIDHR